MPLLVEARVAAGSNAARRPERRRPDAQWRPALEIGLVNNMPDAALKATEVQFVRLLDAAAGETVVRLHLLNLPEIPRSAAVRTAMRGRYAERGATLRGVDALIVTGCEPKAARLDEEPYWRAFTELVDWAEGNTISTVWSCLAAHAAVLHLDGIARRRLPRKRFGLFACSPRSDAGPLLDGLGPTFRVPHSRWNDLDEADLRAHGYTVLARSAEAGVDTFSKQWKSLFLFFQGHPEYDRDTLLREYRRDMTRYLRNERDTPPDLPEHYFDVEAREALGTYAVAAAQSRGPEAWARLPGTCGLDETGIAAWRPAAVQIYRNWLSHVAAVKAAKG